MAVALLGVSILSACAPAMLSRGDRKNVCQVAVLETRALESPKFQPNPLSVPLSDTAGGIAVGAMEGAANAAALIGPNPFAFPTVVILAPVGAVTGAGHAATCLAASKTHPTAEADFRELFLAAYSGRLKQALESELNAPREGCPPQEVGTVPGASPETLIEIYGVKFGMGCAFGKQEYWIEVKWRAKNAMTKGVLGKATTRCRHTSFWEVDEWFANREKARAEIDGVLNMTAKWMATELVTEGHSSACQFQSTESAEVELK